MKPQLALALLVCATLHAGPAKKPPPSALEKACAERLRTLDKTKAEEWMAFARSCCEQGWLLHAQGRDALQQALKLDPTLREAHQLLGEVEVDGTWMTLEKGMAKLAEIEKKHVAQKEAFYGDRWMPVSEIEPLRQADRDELQWAVQTRLDTEHLRLYSDQPWLPCQRWALILENEVQAYRVFHGPRMPLNDFEPLRVYIVKGLEAFKTVTQKALGQPAHSELGFYDFNMKILFVNLVEEEPVRTEQTAVHEFFHGLDNVAQPWRSRDIPPWILEGRAIHFGYSVRDGVIRPGSVYLCEDNLRIDEAIGHGLDFVRLVETPVGAWYRPGPERSALYAAAWAATHYLLHGEDGKHAEGFRTFLEGLPEKNTVADFEAAVAPLAQVEAGLKKHCPGLAALKIPMGPPEKTKPDAKPKKKK